MKSYGRVKWHPSAVVEVKDSEGRRFKKTLREAWVLYDVEPHVVMRMKRVFPRIPASGHGAFRLTDTEESSRELLWFMERFPLSVSKKDRERLEERAKAHALREEAISRVLAGKYRKRDFSLALPPRDYQQVAAELALATGGLLVGDDLGLGKTCIGLCCIAEGPRPALVVTMTHLTRQWAREVERFLPDARYHIIRNGAPYDLTARRPRVGLHGEVPDILIINYAKLTRWADHLQGITKTIVYDEVQEFRRGEESAKGRSGYHLSRGAELRLGLSATPIHNYGGEIFWVMEALRPGALGGWEEFMEEWCTDDDRQRKVSIQNPSAFGEYARSAGLMLRRTRKDVARELPAVTRIPHQVSADTSWLDKANDAATELARLIMESTEKGQAFRAAGELELLLRRATGIAKAPYVAEFVRLMLESEKKVILGGWHHTVYDIWADRLADFDPLFYTGRESASRKDAIRRQFIEDEDSRLLVLSLRSGAGLDGLQEVCRTVIFGELDWSPAVHEQFTGRVHRDGQTDPVCAYYLFTTAGIDVDILDVLGVKRAQLSGIRDPGGYDPEIVDRKGKHLRRLAEAYYSRRDRADDRESRSAASGM